MDSSTIKEPNEVIVATKKEAGIIETYAALK
jgi:hypothetical protein